MKMIESLIMIVSEKERKIYLQVLNGVELT